MRNTQKLVALLLCLTLLVSALAIFAAAEDAPEATEPQPTVVEPNCTVSQATSITQFTDAVKSDMEGNQFGATLKPNEEAWDLVTTADGNQFVSFHSRGVAFKALIDLAPPSGQTYFKDYPTFIVEYELINTGTNDRMNQTFLARTDGVSGYAINTGMILPNLFANVAVGEHAKISAGFVADAATHSVRMFIYVNGELLYNNVHTFADAEAFNKSYIHGFRMLYGDIDNDTGEAKQGSNVILDNVYTRSFDTTVTDVIDENGKIADQYSQFARADHKYVTIPAFATVNGVEYNSVGALNMAISGSDTIPEVEFLSDYTTFSWLGGEKVIVGCNAVVNTNGFIDAEDLDLSNASKCEINGNVITVFAPNYNSYGVDFASTSGKNAFAAAIKSQVPGNEGVDIGTGLTANAPSEGQFTVYAHAGASFGSINRVTADAQERVNVTFGKVPTFSEYQYAVMQFEAGYYGTTTIYGTFAPTFLLNGGANGVALSNGTLFNGMAQGEVAQFTIVLYAYANADNPDTAEDESLTSTFGFAVYRNGEELYVVNQQTTHSVDKIKVREFRRENTATSVMLGNVYTKHFTTDPRTLSDDGKTLLALESDQFTNEAFTPMIPAIATVNGTEYNTVSAVNEAIAASEGTVNIEFLHNYAATPWGMTKVRVDGSAVIKTGGFVTADDLVCAPGYDCFVDGDTIVTHVSNWGKTSLAGVDNNTANTKANDATKSALGLGASTSLSFYKSDDKYILNEYNGNVFLTAKALEKSVADNADEKQPRLEIYYNNYSSYKYKLYNYLVAQFDSCYIGDAPTDGSIRPLSYIGGPLESVLYNKNLYKGLKSGEVAQFTILFYVIPHADNAETEADESNFGDYYIAAYRNGVKLNDTCIKTNIDLTATYPRQLRAYQGNAHLAFDNIFFNNYTTDPRVVDENGITTFVNDQFTNPAYSKLVIPPVANIDGVEVSYDEAEALLADGGEHTVELLHNPIRTLTVSSTSTINTYGYTGIVAGDGYLIKTVNGVTTIAPDERTTNLKLVVDGVEIATIENVRYAIDHEALVRSSDAFLANGNVYYKDGKYYALTWDLAKPEYAEEITYNATATYDKLIVVDVVNNAVLNDRLTYDEEGVLTGGAFEDVTTAVYFNEDITSTVNSGVFKFGNSTWNMNGHAFNHTAIVENAHAITVHTNFVLTIANGTFNINGGASFFYSMEGGAPAITLDEVTINTNALIVDWRSGTFTFNNCTINNGSVMLGARTSTDTYIVFNGGSIKTDLGKGSFVNYHDNDTWGSYGVVNEETGELIAAQLPNVARHVTFNGTKINLIGTIAKMPVESFAVALNGEENNRLVTFINCELYAKHVYADSEHEGKVVFGDNVKYAISDITDEIFTLEGVQLGVKINDNAYEFLATKNYATVNWGEEVEYWADGTTPVAPEAYKNAAVTTVTAGETYTFEATTGAAESYELLANLFLTSDIFFNVYVDGEVASVTFNGVEAIVDGNKYSYELVPARALREIYLVIRFADGSVYSTTTGLMDYVTESAADTEYEFNAELVQVYANMLTYLLAVEDYEDLPLARSEAEAFIRANAPATPDEVDAAYENMATYFDSAFFYLAGEIKLIIEVKDSVTAVKVNVGEIELDLVAEEIIVLTLPVHALADEIVFTVGEETATYSLAAYAASEAVGADAQAVANALYNYAYAAKAYKEISAPAEQ